MCEEAARLQALNAAKRLRDKLYRAGFHMQKSMKDASGTAWYRIVDDDKNVVLGDRFTATYADCELYSLLPE